MIARNVLYLVRYVLPPSCDDLVLFPGNASFGVEKFASDDSVEISSDSIEFGYGIIPLLVKFVQLVDIRLPFPLDDRAGFHFLFHGLEHFLRVLGNDTLLDGFEPLGDLVIGIVGYLLKLVYLRFPVQTP